MRQKVADGVQKYDQFQHQQCLRTKLDNEDGEESLRVVAKDNKQQILGVSRADPSTATSRGSFVSIILACG